MLVGLTENNGTLVEVIVEKLQTVEYALVPELFNALTRQ